MASLSDVLAGLGKGVSTFASLQHQSNLERQAKEERDAQTQREIAQDALRRTLLQLQIDKAKQPAAPRRSVVDDGRAVFDEDAGTVTPSGYTPFEKPDAPVKQPAPVQVSPGSSLVDPVTGKRIYHEPDRPPTPPNGGTPTEGERKTAALLESARAAFSGLSNASNPSVTDVTLGRLPVVGQAFKGGSRQVQEQSGYELMDAYLRLVSGANLPEAEVRRKAVSIVPQFGDTEALATRKAATRKAMLRSIEIAAGRSASQATPLATTPADRWEQLVRDGVDKEQATELVKVEFGL